MPNVHLKTPRVKARRLRIFADAKEAKAWEESRAGHGTICLVDGPRPTLRWYFQPGRCYEGRRTPTLPPDDLRAALRRLLAREGTDFYNGICQGDLQGFAPERLPFLVSTICQMTGAKP